MREDEKKTKRIQVRITATTSTVISDFREEYQIDMSDFITRAVLEKIERHKNPKTGDDLNIKWIAKDFASINRKVAKGRAESEKLQAELEDFQAKSEAFQNEVRQALKELCLYINPNHQLKKDGAL
jgi:septal ring factor EnvC (AmiA/AmiB activator)